jgi:hypothetical protein
MSDLVHTYDSDADSESYQNDNTLTDTSVSHTMVKWTTHLYVQEVLSKYHIYLNIWQEFYPKFIRKMWVPLIMHRVIHILWIGSMCLSWLGEWKKNYCYNNCTLFDSSDCVLCASMNWRCSLEGYYKENCYTDKSVSNNVIFGYCDWPRCRLQCSLRVIVLHYHWYCQLQ